MPRRGTSARALAVAALVAAAVLGGCGGGASGGGHAAAKPLSGAAVFQSAGCSSCHTLAAAHASGRVGPDLDRLKPDFTTVEHQVRVGGGAMPAFATSLSPKQIRAVAQYVNKTTHRREGP
jgi:mono/diheme cytochrome c family protein